MSNKDDFKIKYYMVCIIDVLGQKHKLAGWAELPNDGQWTPKLKTAFAGTADTVHKLKNRFLEEFEQWRPYTPDNCPALSPEQRGQLDLLEDSKIDVQQFSDTFVFYSSMQNSYGDNAVTALCRILATCCLTMLTTLVESTPVRGAITIGTGMELEDRNFYGPALAEAHHLESEVAGYPRVVVSDKVRGLLYANEAYSPDPEVHKHMKKMADMCLSFLCQDVDGFWIVDFLGKGFYDLNEPEDEFLLGVRKAYKFVQNEAERFRVKGNVKLAKRYHWLQQYIGSRLPIWGLEPKA